jgi:hypothetical protein
MDLFTLHFSAASEPTSFPVDADGNGNGGGCIIA